MERQRFGHRVPERHRIGADLLELPDVVVLLRRRGVEWPDLLDPVALGIEEATSRRRYLAPELSGPAKRHRLERIVSHRSWLCRDHAFNPLLVMTQADITTDLSILPGASPGSALRSCP